MKASLKRSFLLLGAFLLTNTIWAQYIVSAKVKDKNTSVPLAYCSIALLPEKGEGSFAITDNAGYFEIPADNGKYRLIARYVGYVSDTITVKVHGKSVFLGPIKLEAENKELEGVVIASSTKSVDIDKDEVLITNKMRTGASSAREVLEKVNGVSYDRYKDQIKVDNNTNIIILVNGLQKNEEYVKNLDPERIAKIEVVRDPGGRYGIDGYTAILNIVLKQNYIGQELFLSGQNIYDTKAPSSNLILPIQNYSLNYNFSRKNLNLYSRLAYNKQVFALKHTEEIKYSDGLLLEHLSPNDKRNMSSNNESYSALLGGDYILNKKNIISAEMNISVAPTAPTEMDYIYRFAQDTLKTEIPYSTLSNTSSKSFSTSLFYIGNYSDSKELKADLTFGLNSSDSKSKFGYKDSAQVINLQNSNLTYAHANVEYTQVVSNRMSFQLGYGGIWKENHNDNLVDGLNSNFLYTELRNKAFAYGIWKLRKDLKLKVGIGTENSIIQQNNLTRNFWIYMPHVDLFYKPAEWFNIKLKYRVLSDYPSIGQTDSTETHIDLFTVQKGNPNLAPSSIHKLSLKMNILSGLLSVEPYIEYSNNYIAPVGILRTDGLFMNTYGNLGTYQNQGVEINFTIPFGKSIVWQNSADIYHSKMAYENINNSLSDWSGESQLMYIKQDINLVAGLLYQRANGRVLSLQGYSNQQNDWWGLMVQKSFFKNQFNIMAMAFLPIDWLANYEQVTYLETNAYTQKGVNDISLLKHLFLVRLTYRFHKGKSITSIEKDVEREQTKKKSSMF